MAVPVFMRFSNLHNLLRINNNVVGTSSNRTQFLSYVLRLCSTAQNATEVATKNIQMDGLSKAMKAYLERSMKYEEFIKEETVAYETGKRHLANMMGMDPENFTQKDIDKSLEYLFPSGLYDPKARPMMKHPSETFPAQKEAEFGADGKPFHSFFFTKQPNYYKALHDIVTILKDLDDLEDKYIKTHGLYPPEKKIDQSDSLWLTKQDIEKILIEQLSDQNYEYFIKTLNRVINHRMATHVKEFIMKYRKRKVESSNQHSLLPILYDENQRPYVSVFPCQRKSAVGKVIVWGQGTGKITINGQDISYFKDIHTREQVSFYIGMFLLFFMLHDTRKKI